MHKYEYMSLNLYRRQTKGSNGIKILFRSWVSPLTESIKLVYPYYMRCTIIRFSLPTV